MIYTIGKGILIYISFFKKVILGGDILVIKKYEGRYLCVLH